MFKKLAQKFKNVTQSKAEKRLKTLFGSLSVKCNDADQYQMALGHLSVYKVNKFAGQTQLDKNSLSDLIANADEGYDDRSLCAEQLLGLYAEQGLSRVNRVSCSSFGSSAASISRFNDERYLGVEQDDAAGVVFYAVQELGAADDIFDGAILATRLKANWLDAGNQGARHYAITPVSQDLSERLNGLKIK